MRARNAYLEFLLEQLAPLGEITSRAMMGGYVLYCDGGVFALVAHNTLFLKADDLNRGMFEERGLQPFRPYEDRHEVMSYYEAPPEIFEDSDALVHWCRPSVDAGRRAAAKRRPKKKGAKA